MSTVLTAASCNDCPFAEITDGDSFCRARIPPNNISLYLTQEPPRWCPLRKAEHLVKLRKP